MKHYVALPVLLLSILSFSSHINAFTYMTCNGKPITQFIPWHASEIELRISDANFPVLSDADLAIKRAIIEINEMGGTSLKFKVERTSDGGEWGDLKNDLILGRWIGQYYDPDALATIMLDYSNTCSSPYIYEADIVFSSGHWDNFEFGKFSYENMADFGWDGPHSFEGIALHELGHLVGLEHTTTTLDTMLPDAPGGGPLGKDKRWIPLPDMARGIRFLYPGGSKKSGVEASAFQFVSTFGEVSSEILTLPVQVKRGNTLRFSYTFAITGTEKETFNIFFYLSKDDKITTSDILVGSNTGAWGNPGSVGTYTRTISVPNWINTGDYFLGYIIDKNNNGQIDGSSVAIATPTKIY